MSLTNRMKLGSHEFSVDKAHFRYVPEGESAPGWDFDFSGRCLNDDPERVIFPYGFRLFAEAAPLPLRKRPDYTGVEMAVSSSYDEATGEPLFGLNVWEEHEVAPLRLRFSARDGSRYRVELSATVAETVFGHPEQLELNAWAIELPDAN